MARIENHKYTIDEAFRECFYIIPDYQREYVWTEKEVCQLLEDIGEQVELDAKEEYFIGTILVSPTEDKNYYEVIDGQQRLTTFFLLLCALKNLFHGEPQGATISSRVSDSYTDRDGQVRTSLKLEPRYENAGEVMTRLVELDTDPQSVNSSIHAAGIANFGSVENLLGAYSTLYSYLQDKCDNVTELKRYWGFLANNVVFIQISTDVGRALKIFETINERGVGLSPMDLLKNLLFKQVKKEQFLELKNEWKKITNLLEQGRQQPLRFLPYFLMANYVVSNKRGDYSLRKDEIYDWFLTKENAALCQYETDPFGFVRKTTRNAESYLAFAHAMGNDGKPNLPMRSLKRLTGSGCSLHYILLLAAAHFPKPLFNHLVSQLESFLFYYLFSKTSTKELERSFSLWAEELREIGEVDDPVEQKMRLNAFVEARFKKSMDDKWQKLVDTLKRFRLRSVPKYRAIYLLARLTQHIDMAFGGVKVRGCLDPFMNLQIEHILPQNPDKDLLEKWAIENPGKDYDDYKERLGNLTLLEKPLNIVARNDFYAAKCVTYKKSSSYLTRSLAELADIGQNTSVSRINTQIQSFSEWNSVAIEERQSMLIDLVKDIWKITPIELGRESVMGMAETELCPSV